MLQHLSLFLYINCLLLLAPHVHITQGREVLLSFGSPLILTCENTEGIFHGIFRWTHNLLELSESNELYIPYVTAENSGEYTCSVSVCSIDVRDSISVIVSGTYLSSYSLAVHSYLVIEGYSQNVKIICDFSGTKISLCDVINTFISIRIEWKIISQYYVSFT